MGCTNPSFQCQRSARTLSSVAPGAGGCCGLAGNFGVEVGHYDISVAIAEHSLLPAVREADRETEVAGNDLNGEIDYLNGAITFRDQVSWTLPAAGGPAGPPESIAGKHLRIYYRTPQNWALQFTKAFDQIGRAHV